MRKELAWFRGQAHGVDADGRRAAAAWVDRCIDGRVLEAVRERGQQVSPLSSCCFCCCLNFDNMQVHCMVGACSLNLAVLERGLAVLRRGYSPAWRFFCFCILFARVRIGSLWAKKIMTALLLHRVILILIKFRAKTETVLKSVCKMQQLGSMPNWKS